MILDDLLSREDQEWVTQTFTTHLTNAFGETLEEGYLNGEGWAVNIVKDSTADLPVEGTRRGAKHRYYATGMASVHANSRFWSTAPFAQAAISSLLQTSLRLKPFPSANVTNYLWPLVDGETMTTLKDAESPDEGDSTFGALGVIGFGVILGAIVFAGLIGLIGYHIWVRCQVPIGHQTHAIDPQPLKHSVYVDHVAGNFDPVAGHSEDSQSSELDSSEQSSDPSFNEMDAFDDACLSEGSDLRADNNEADIKPADSQIAVAVESPPQLSDQYVGNLGSSGSFLEQCVGNLGTPVDASCSVDGASGEEQELRTSFSVADGNPDLDWYADVDLSVRFFESKESGLEHPTQSLNNLSRGPSILSSVPEASEQIIDQSFNGLNLFDDARLQEGGVLKPSGQPIDQRMGNFGTSGSLNPGNTTCSLAMDGADLKEELMLDGNLDLDLSKDIDLAVRFFESNDPRLERTLSTLSTGSIQGPERSLSGLSSSSEPASSTSYMAPSA